MGWIVVVALVLLVMIVIGIYNALVRLRVQCGKRLGRYRRAAQAPLRPDPQPRRNRKGLRRARKGHARSRDHARNAP